MVETRARDEATVIGTKFEEHSMHLRDLPNPSDKLLDQLGVVPDHRRYIRPAFTRSFSSGEYARVGGA